MQVRKNQIYRDQRKENLKDGAKAGPGNRNN